MQNHRESATNVKTAKKWRPISCFTFMTVHEAKHCVLWPESGHSDTYERSNSGHLSRVPEVCVEVFELLLVALHGLEHQLDHLLTVAGAPLVWAGGKEMENQGNGRVYFHKKTQCYGRSEHTRMPSEPLGFSRSLRNNSMAFPSLGEQRREGS